MQLSAEPTAAQPVRGELRSCAIIGPGRLGLHLALRVHACGWRCLGIRGRRLPAADLLEMLPPDVPVDTWDARRRWHAPEVIMICVPDRQIAAVAEQLATTDELGRAVVLHTSGLTPSSVLAPLRASCSVGSWHPLQSFPPLPTGAVAWQGVPCAIEGDGAAVRGGFSIAEDLGLVPWRIEPELKPLYHAAASVGANLTHILVVIAKQLMAGSGLPEGDPGSLLEALILHSIRAALSAQGFEALTGPLARSDHETIQRHLQVLPATVADAYRAIIELARNETS